MQSTRHDGNLAALHASSLPGYVLDVVVLTSDGGLLATLREASSPEHAIWHAPSADEAVDYLVGGRCGILVADLGTLRSDAASLLARLHSQFPELVLMATGRRNEEAAVASLVGDGRIYRFLHKPISPARANLFLGAATRRYYELRDTEPMMLATVKTMAQRPRTLRIVSAIAAVVIMTIAAVWLLLGSQQSDPAREQAVASAARTEGQIEELLGRANMALGTDRLIEPRANNALELYREVLALAPNHPEAAAGEQRVIAALEAKVVAALQARDPQAGAATLTALQRAQPNHPRYAQLYRRLIELSRSQTPALPPRTASPPVRASALEPTVAPAPVDAPQEAIEESLASAEEPPAEGEPIAALEEQAQAFSDTETPDAHEDAFEQLALATRLRERGLLIEPIENNAFDALIALRSQYPGLGEIADEQRRLASALIDHARTVLAASDVETTAKYLDKAAELEPNSPIVRSLRAQQQAALADLESKRVVPAGALKRTREVSPEYPYDAQVRGIQGWADVEFTIALDGTTRDLVVRDSEPKGVFDRSAVEALRRWRFEPISRNGEPVEQRAMLRLKYELAK